MKRLVLESWMLLLYFELIMKSHDFKHLFETVKRHKVTPTPPSAQISAERLCHAVDLACVLYVKRVECLQRSSATTRLLRRHGWNAELVIGAQLAPAKRHAWCEINGVVINDKPHMCATYQVFERC
jgi:hypothetical protein